MINKIHTQTLNSKKYLNSMIEVIKIKLHILNFKF
jgi:hypothetical protein